MTKQQLKNPIIKEQILDKKGEAFGPARHSMFALSNETQRALNSLEADGQSANARNWRLWQMNGPTKEVNRAKTIAEESESIISSSKADKKDSSQNEKRNSMSVASMHIYSQKNRGSADVSQILPDKKSKFFNLQPMSLHSINDDTNQQSSKSKKNMPPKKESKDEDLLLGDMVNEDSDEHTEENPGHEVIDNAAEIFPPPGMAQLPSPKSASIAKNITEMEPSPSVRTATFEPLGFEISNNLFNNKDMRLNLGKRFCNTDYQFDRKSKTQTEKNLAFLKVQGAHLEVQNQESEKKSSKLQSRLQGKQQGKNIIKQESSESVCLGDQFSSSSEKEDGKMNSEAQASFPIRAETKPPARKSNKPKDHFKHMKNISTFGGPKKGEKDSRKDIYNNMKKFSTEVWKQKEGPIDDYKNYKLRKTVLDYERNMMHHPYEENYFEDKKFLAQLQEEYAISIKSELTPLINDMIKYL